MKKIVLALALALLIPAASAAQTVTADLTAASSSCLPTNCLQLVVPVNVNVLTISLSGTWTGTTVFEYSVNGGAYAALTAVNITTLATATGSTANGNWVATNPGFTTIRVRASAFSVGPITAVIKGTTNGSVVGIIFGSGSGGTIGTVNQGTAGVDPWLVTCNNCGSTTLGQATMANSLPVTMASNQATFPVNLSTGSAQIGHLEANQSVNVAQINGVTVLMNAGNTGTGSQRVTEATDSTLSANSTTLAGIVTSARAATNPVVGQSGVAAGAGSVGANVQRVTLASDDPLVVAATTASTPFLANALTNSAVAVDSNAGVLDSYFCYNPNDEVSYVQIFDATSPSVGSTTPKWSVGIPAAGAGNLSGMNLSFSNAIKVAATTTATGSTAPDVAINCNFGSH